MRQRTTGLVALGAGVFFLVLAVLLRFYAVPTLEVVPSDYWTHYTATGNGTVLDTRDGSQFKGALTQDITIKGNLAPTPAAPANSVVWDYASELSFAQSSPCATSGPFTKNQCPVSFSNETVAFDHSTAAVLAWAGDKVDDGPTQHKIAQSHTPGSFISKFPFGMAAHKDYPMWDGVSGTAPSAKFVDSETFRGITVYRYIQTIGSTSDPVLLYDEPSIPAALVGDIAVDGKNPGVWYSSVTTALVDPISGIPVAGDQKIRLTAGSLDGSDKNRLTLLDVDLKLDKVQVTDGSDQPKWQDAAATVPQWTDYSDQAVRDAKAADRITLVKNTLPLISLILGLLLLFAGIYLTMRFEGRKAPAGPAPDPGQAGAAPAAAPASADPDPDEETTKVVPAAEEEDPATAKMRPAAAEEEDPATTKARATVSDKAADEEK